MTTENLTKYFLWLKKTISGIKDKIMKYYDDKASNMRKDYEKTVGTKMSNEKFDLINARLNYKYGEVRS